MNKTVAQDVFSKGVREIIFSEGMTEKELLDFCEALALRSEESAMKGGISSILWEREAVHIKVIEAGLDEIIETDGGGGKDGKHWTEASASAPIGSLLLGDLKTDPAEFGRGLIALAKQTKKEDESVEDRLFALYNEVGRKIGTEQSEQRDMLFEDLAQSALSLQQPYRERLIAGKLYTELDAELAEEQTPDSRQQVPNDFHEIITGRFSKDWAVPQVTELLKRNAAKEVKSPAPAPPPALYRVEPITDDLIEITKELAEYTPEEMEELKIMGEKGTEFDVIEAAVRTLIFLLPLVKRSDNAPPDRKTVKLFSSVVHQLEDLQVYLLKQKDYDMAGLIVRVFHMPADPAFKPRLEEGIKKTTSTAAITATVKDLRTFPKGSHEYASAYSYLLTAEREATEVLLQLLAEEAQRSAREFLMTLLKDVGKNQLLLIGEHISDKRWYFVRNIVHLLGQAKTDHVIEFLQKVANHKHIRIRQEVVNGLVGIGGKKAAGHLAKFLQDEEPEVQVMAIHGLAEMEGIGAAEARPLMTFLAQQPLKMGEQDVTLEAIVALARIGGVDAAEFLKRYERIRWWRSRKLQMELRSAAQRAIERIKRRLGDVEPAKR